MESTPEYESPTNSQGEAPRCPVTGASVFEHRDWATDFDHADPVYNANAPLIWDDLRGRCPVAHTDAYGGTWLPVSHDMISAIAYDTDRFSSLAVVVSNDPPDPATAPLGIAPPITSDPPAHYDVRRLLLPAFSPQAISRWEPEVRALCRVLLDDIEARLGPDRRFDAALEYAQHIPVNVIARMLGVPLKDVGIFREFVHLVLEAIDVPAEERAASFDRIVRYIHGVVTEHRSNP